MLLLLLRVVVPSSSLGSVRVVHLLRCHGTWLAAVAHVSAAWSKRVLAVASLGRERAVVAGRCVRVGHGGGRVVGSRRHQRRRLARGSGHARSPRSSSAGRGARGGAGRHRAPAHRVAVYRADPGHSCGGDPVSSRADVGRTNHVGIAAVVPELSRDGLRRRHASAHHLAAELRVHAHLLLVHVPSWPVAAASVHVHVVLVGPELLLLLHLVLLLLLHVHEAVGRHHPWVPLLLLHGSVGVVHVHAAVALLLLVEISFMLLLLLHGRTIRRSHPEPVLVGHDVSSRRSAAVHRVATGELLLLLHHVVAERVPVSALLLLHLLLLLLLLPSSSGRRGSAVDCVERAACMMRGSRVVGLHAAGVHLVVVLLHLLLLHVPLLRLLLG